MTTPANEPREIKSLPAATQENAEWVQERLEREKQKRFHRRILFGGTLVICTFFFLMFICQAQNIDALCRLGESSPYCVWIIALLGIIPTVLLAALMRGVFAKEGKEQSSDADHMMNAVSVGARLNKQI